MHDKVDEQQLAIARVYARSLLELARKNHEEESILEEFDTLWEHLRRQPEFEQVLYDPGVDEVERAEILERVLRNRANDLLVNTLQVMNRKDRTRMFRALVQAYREELEELQGVVEASATTAVPLPEETRKRLVEVLERRTGKKIVLHESIDETLLGGMTLRLGDHKFDSSIARELWRVGALLDERASSELHAEEMVEP